MLSVVVCPCSGATDIRITEFTYTLCVLHTLTNNLRACHFLGMDTHRFLLDAEVAELLRCRPSYVRRLRLSGRLAYVPGRPAIIERVDLENYISRCKVKGQPVLWREQEDARPVGQEERQRLTSQLIDLALGEWRRRANQEIRPASRSSAWLENALAGPPPPAPRPPLRDTPKSGRRGVTDRSLKFSPPKHIGTPRQAR